MYMARIAVLDDDVTMLEMVEGLLQGAGHQVSVFSSGRQLIRTLHRESFDIFLLDWNVPDMSGVSVLEWIRNQIGNGPAVLLVTNRTGDEDVVAGLRAGADDFVAKPFRAPVLLARIDALLRRSSTVTGRSAETYGNYEFNLQNRCITSEGVQVDMTPKEFNLSLLIFRNLNRAVARSYMMETIWGMDPGLPTRTLDIHISKVRTKLNLRPENGYRLTTIYGYGYRLEEVMA